MLCLKGKSRRYTCRSLVCMLFIFGGITLCAQTQRFRMEFTYNTEQLSAMLILKNEGDILKGSMVNEFGVNFVDFTVKNKKAKIIRLNPILKRPFLKKVLRRDFELLADCLNRETDETLWSKKRGIYHASCIKLMDPETKLLSLQLEHLNLPLKISLYPF